MCALKYYGIFFENVRTPAVRLQPYCQRPFFWRLRLSLGLRLHGLFGLGQDFVGQAEFHAQRGRATAHGPRHGLALAVLGAVDADGLSLLDIVGQPLGHLGGHGADLVGAHAEVALGMGDDLQSTRALLGLLLDSQVAVGVVLSQEEQATLVVAGTGGIDGHLSEHVFSFHRALRLPVVLGQAPFLFS